MPPGRYGPGVELAKFVEPDTPAVPVKEAALGIGVGKAGSGEVGSGVIAVGDVDAVCAGVLSSELGVGEDIPGMVLP